MANPKKDPVQIRINRIEGPRRAFTSSRGLRPRVGGASLRGKQIKSDPVIARLNRLEGQIKGIRRMYQTNRACMEIVQQIQAARAALGKLTSTLLSDEAKKCADEGDLKELRKVVEKTFKTI